MNKRSQSTTETSGRQPSPRSARRTRNGDGPAPPGHAAADDGGLVMTDANGSVIHAVPPAVTEALRYLLAGLRLRSNERLPQSVGLISSVSGEGVTFVARSLALVLANDYDRSVCLVDANWSGPSPIEGVGLAGILGGDTTSEGATVHTGHPRLDLLPAGAASAAQRPVFAQSVGLKTLLASLCERYDHVIVDLPATGSSSEGLIVADLLDAVAVVVRQGVTTEGQVRDTVEQLGTTRVLGVILNAVNTRTPKMLLRRILSW